MPYLLVSTTSTPLHGAGQKAVMWGGIVSFAGCILFGQIPRPVRAHPTRFKSKAMLAHELPPRTAGPILKDCVPQARVTASFFDSSTVAPPRGGATVRAGGILSDRWQPSQRP